MLNFMFKKWISIMIEGKNDCFNLKEKYAYLKVNGVRCKVKNIGVTEASMGMGIGIAVQNVSLDVHYKDVEKAKQLLKNNL